MIMAAASDADHSSALWRLSQKCNPFNHRRVSLVLATKNVKRRKTRNSEQYMQSYVVVIAVVIVTIIVAVVVVENKKWW